MEERATVIFNMTKRKEKVDIDIPLNITAQELVYALNNTFELNIDVNDNANCYFQMENPIALLKGTKTLKKFHVRNGSVIYFTR